MIPAQSQLRRFPPDDIHQGWGAVCLDPGISQLRQLLVVGPRVVAQAGGQAHGQLQEGDLHPLNLRVAVQQLKALSGHQTVAEG